MTSSRPVRADRAIEGRATDPNAGFTDNLN